MTDTPIDPRLLDDDPTQNQPRAQPAVTLPSGNLDNADDASDLEGQEAGAKRRKLNLLKCRQCRDARKKCFPADRVWPQKCDRCRQHKPQELDCSEPQLNTRKRGPNIPKTIRRSKTQPTLASDKQELRGRESDEDSSADEMPVFERPVRTTVMRGIKREPPGSPRPIAEPPPAAKEELLASAYLPLGEREFRILVLAAGRREDREIRCSFFTASINAPPEYEAVSYLWGGSNEAKPTMVEIKLLDSQGKSYPIFTKSNLYNALRSLRHPKDSRKFWVDALCINRSNDVEKNQQVAMKPTIFRKATNNCFWLGEDANSKAALNFIPRILNLTAIDRLVRDDSAIEGWVAFVALLKNAVFSRLWLVQEVAVAQNVTLHCGQPAIHYGDLVDAVAMFVSFRDHISNLFRRCNRNHKELADRKIGMAERFVEVSTNCLRASSTGIQRLLSLESLVSQLGDLSATDPRDRVFSVLAIAKDGLPLTEDTLMEVSPHDLQREALRIDYDRKVVDVYQDFVIHVIEHSHSLDIICRHWASSVSEREANLPTWVRPLQSSHLAPFDTNISERTAADSLVGLPDRNYYNSSRGTLATFRIGSQSFSRFKSLFPRGFRVDTISKLGPRASEGIILYEWLELGGCVNIDESAPPESFWRTIVADRGPNGSNAPSWYSRAFLYCLHHLTPTGDLNTNRLIAECEAESTLVVDFLQRVQSVIWNRKFLVSAKGQVGLAPMAAQVGDVICVLYGCSVPVVLREQKDDEGTSWQLVGECYLHGMMDGEAIEAASEFQEEEFELQ